MLNGCDKAGHCLVGFDITSIQSVLDSTARSTFSINITISIQTMTAAFNSIDSNMSSINGSGGADEGSVKEPSWILFVSGPTGSGKSSVAKFLASRLGAHYLEGDDVRSVG